MPSKPLVKKSESRSTVGRKVGVEKRAQPQQAVEQRPQSQPEHQPQQQPQTSTPARVKRIPTNVPSVYADRIEDVVYGIHTTKLVLGVENGSHIESVGVVIIPTMALLQAAAEIQANLTSPPMIEEMGGRYSAAMRLLTQDFSTNNKTKPAK